MTFRPFSVCVFCGARSGNRPEYIAVAEATGRALAEAGWRLIFGAGDVGLMGAAADAARRAGGETLGVIPGHLIERERRASSPAAGHENVVVTETMHERKKVMFTNSDAVMVLPGGAGSLDEFFEVLTWAQLGLHRKPILLVNAEGYWDPLVALVRHVIDEGFAAPSLLGLFTVATGIEDAMEILSALAAPDGRARSG